MTQSNKNLLMIGGLAVIGYLIYKQVSKPKNFANASGRLRFKVPSFDKVISRGF
jgi:hypothetical protein